VKRALRLKAHERGGGFVALNHQVPCGFAMLTYWVNVAEISDLFVVPGYRGQGIGTRILETLLEKARKAGYTNIEIGVLASNTRAQRLYERVGFVPVRTIQHRFPHGYEDIIYLLSSPQ
jgi:ribosomal-protein-alanine N-acetyltransferase